MAMNDLSFQQIATVLNAIHQQATGQAAQSVLNTQDFVTVAQAVLKTGYDSTLQAISQVLSRTIFSVRPYNRKFKGLEASEIRYGNHVRKLNIADKAWETDDRKPLTEGASVDQQIVSKPVILQTNFYGQDVYQRHYTVFRDQLDVAFSSPDEFARFVGMVTQNASDMIEQAHENLARNTLVNYIGGVYEGPNATNQVVHLLTEYNTATGQSLTLVQLMTAANYPAFVKWAFARIAALASLLTERSTLYHTNVTNKVISRHTPYERLKTFILASDKFGIESRVLADTFHDSYLSYPENNETVNFWQSIQSPASINAAVTFMKTDGTLDSTQTAAISPVFGVLLDEEAAGYTVVNQWSAPAPFNARGGYTNIWYHFTDRYWNDFTENGIVLVLD